MRHTWPDEGDPGFHRIPACESPDGNDRTEKTCAKCSLVKITVHGPQGFPWREWRTKEGKPWHGDSTPPCLVTEVAAI